jgi:hypothetical protein
MEVKPYPGDPLDAGCDAAWEVTAPDYATQLLVEAFRRFTPRDVDRVLGGVSPLVRKIMRDPPIIVVAPWLSPRSRQLLTERGMNYIDLTGNVRLKVVRPAIHLRLDGAQHDPDPPVKPPVRLQGAGINALVRIMVDVEPPYRMVELARGSKAAQEESSQAPGWPRLPSMAGPLPSLWTCSSQRLSPQETADATPACQGTAGTQPAGHPGSRRPFWTTPR